MGIFGMCNAEMKAASTLTFSYCKKAKKLNKPQDRIDLQLLAFKRESKLYQPNTLLSRCVRKTVERIIIYWSFQVILFEHFQGSFANENEGF